MNNLKVVRWLHNLPTKGISFLCPWRNIYSSQKDDKILVPEVKRCFLMLLYKNLVVVKFQLMGKVLIDHILKHILIRHKRFVTRNTFEIILTRKNKVVALDLCLTYMWASVIELDFVWQNVVGAADSKQLQVKLHRGLAFRHWLKSHRKSKCIYWSSRFFILCTVWERSKDMIVDTFLCNQLP